MENKMHQSEDNKYIPMSSVKSGSGTAVRHDVYYYTNQIVNVIMIGASDSDSWVLVDAGMPMCGPEIVTIAENRYGKGTRPQAIILTHGHFDHVGGIVHLIEKWQVPVFAHSLEAPFLTGARSYPEPDPTVEGGLLAKMSSIYPIEPVDIRPALMPLPLDGSVPHLPDWKWIHTPGHSPGQIALFRESDRVLLAADAFVTVRQDSLYKVLIQKKEVNGPPRYLTTGMRPGSRLSVWPTCSPTWLLPGMDKPWKATSFATAFSNWYATLKRELFLIMVNMSITTISIRLIISVNNTCWGENMGRTTRTRSVKHPKFGFKIRVWPRQLFAAIILCIFILL